MTANPALQQLKDIHLPQPIHMWPSAPGWIMLYIMAAALFGYGIYFWYQRRKQRYIINYTLRQLNQLQTLTKHNPDHINIAAEISTLIRRTALYYFNRDVIAGLSGEKWLKFLNETGRTTKFTDTTGRLLIDAPYRKNYSNDIEPLFILTQQWLATITKINRKET